MPAERVLNSHLTLDLRVLDRPFRLMTDSDSVSRVLYLNFFDLIDGVSAPADTPSIVVRASNKGFQVTVPDGSTHSVTTTSELVYYLEKTVIIEVQKQRPDLLFLHAAALESNGRGIILAGDTGAGKSTTTWALLQEGFGYLSDELSAISLDSMEVLPYPHALCLKRQPPSPYALPEGTLDLGATIHVPTPEMTCPIVRQARPLAAVLLIGHDPNAGAPEIRELTPSEAAARLYVTALNSLAHPEAGLPAVLRIASRVPSFVMVTADLQESCFRIRALVRQLGPC